MFSDKHIVSRMGLTLDDLNSRMTILEGPGNLNFQNCQKVVGEKSYEMEEAMKQTKEVKENKEEDKLENEILNIIYNKLDGIVQSLFKRDQEIEDTIESHRVVFATQIQKQDTRLEKNLSDMEDKSINMRKDLENDILKIVDKVSCLSKIDQKMTGIFEQTNNLMMKDANLEGKLSKLEKIQTDMNNKLSNLESADIFLQEANRVLVEKVSDIKEQSYKTELDGKFQQMEISIVDLSREVRDEKGGNSDSKQELRTLKEEMESLEQHIKTNNEKIIQDVEEINVKQNLTLKRQSDEWAKLSDIKLLDLKQVVLSLEQQLGDMKESKLEKLQFEKFEKEVCTLLEKMQKNEAVTLLSKKYNQLTEQISNNERNFDVVKYRIQDDQELLVQKVSEQQHSLVTFFKTIEEKFSKFEKTQKNQVNSLKKIKEDNYDQDDKMNANEHLVSRVETLEQELAEDMNTKGGYTLVVKSEGAVSEHQSDVLGVYRMVDSYNDRPVYKQEGGENYIYYSSTSSSWLVGTVVGHPYGWLRNGSTAAKSARWLPDLSTGWEYRPLIRGWEGLGEGQECWFSDDGTLRIEALRDVDSIHSLIQVMTNSSEVERSGLTRGGSSQAL